MSEGVKTSISAAFADRILVKGYNVAEMAGRYSFGDLVYLLMTGELPRGREGDLVEAMLVCCAEHSITSPSTHVARAVANCGVPLQSAVAAGISALGEHHGGAGEALARAMQETAAAHPGADLATWGKQVRETFRQQGKRVPGLGHRLHNPDPRTVRLIELARGWGLAGRYTQLAEEIARQVSAESGRDLPLNVDGALAGLLSDIGVHWRYAKAVFVMARSAGLAVHVCEELEQGKPFKFIPPQDVEYTGPVERPLPGK